MTRILAPARTARWSTILQARDSSSGCGAISIDLDWAVKDGTFRDMAFLLRDMNVEKQPNYI
jgi:hypothetical protein